MGDEEDLVRVEVENVLMSSHGPVVILAPVEEDRGDRVLPIFIDQSQALNIQLALEGHLSPRPMTHDLFSQVLNELGAIVDRVVIEELAQNTFYASLYVERERDGERQEMRFDARPSDCIALAVRAGARLFVRVQLFDNASVPRADLEPPLNPRVELDEEVGSEGTDLGVSR